VQRFPCRELKYMHVCLFQFNVARTNVHKIPISAIYRRWHSCTCMQLGVEGLAHAQWARACMICHACMHAARRWKTHEFNYICIERCPAPHADSMQSNCRMSMPYIDQMWVFSYTVVFTSLTCRIITRARQT
jgi:hypothetical protein